MAVKLAPSVGEPQVQMDVVAIEAALAPFFRNSLDAIGNRAVQAIRQSLSRPVEVLAGGNVVRSNPGEAPRMETGDLERGIDYEVIDGDGIPELRITAERMGMGDDDAARILEDGGPNGQGNYVAARPFMAPEAERIREYGPKLTIEHLSAKQT